jgi:hypothetical protein
MLSGFYLTAMSIDRLLAVRFPMASSRMCTPGRAKRVISIGTFLIAVANLNLIFTLHYVKDPATGRYIVIWQDLFVYAGARPLSL